MDCLVDDTMDRLASEITWARNRAGLTMKLLAEKTELSPQAISAFEAGTKHPRIETLVKISYVIPLRFDQIFHTVHSVTAEVDIRDMHA